MRAFRLTKKWSFANQLKLIWGGASLSHPFLANLRKFKMSKEGEHSIASFRISTTLEF
jgi:hypothetical protein